MVIHLNINIPRDTLFYGECLKLKHILDEHTNTSVYVQSVVSTAGSIDWWCQHGGA